MRVAVRAGLVSLGGDARGQLRIQIDPVAAEKERCMHAACGKTAQQALRKCARRSVVKRQRHAAGLRRMAAREQDGQRGKQA